jgi:small-conductance mechanosensitive channel
MNGAASVFDLFGGGIGTRVLLTLALLALVVALRALVTAALRRAHPASAEGEARERRRFWLRQASKVGAVLLVAVGFSLIWFDDPARFASIAGLVTAGVAVALQRVITAMAAYAVILRGRVFTVGDRITMGGIRGDVVNLGLIQTSVLEMGEPPGANSGVPDVWVNARQYTGRIVNVTNDKIFDTPVYNYTREFPYMWEEMHFPIAYDEDWKRAESILLDVARRHTGTISEEAAPAIDRLRLRYFVRESPELAPRVFVRMTDNWVELSLRFLVPVHGVRNLKDAMTREIDGEFRSAGLSIASTTFEIVGVPELRIVMAGGERRR